MKKIKRNKALYAICTVLAMLFTLYFLSVKESTTETMLLAFLGVLLSGAFVTLFSHEANKK